MQIRSVRLSIRQGSGATLTIARRALERRAGMDWVPYVAVIGDSEMESGKLTVTIRSKSMPKQPFREEMASDELISKVKEDIGDRPFRPMYTQKKLSIKPRFI